MSKRSKEPLLRCPECGTDMVIVKEIHSVMANTFKHYYHNIKAHDPDAKAKCLYCNWTGERKDLVSGITGDSNG